MGIPPSVDGRVPIHLFASSNAWIEGDATRQLSAVADLAGVRAVAGMPDLHPGKYGPVGCAMLADRVHPAFVGADIGCGMGLWRLDVPTHKLRPDKAAERLRALAEPWDGDGPGGDARTRLIAAGLDPTPFDGALGSIGSGNHFCEVQRIDRIADPDAAAVAGLDADATYLLVHSGSRGLGTATLAPLLAAGLVAFDPDSAAGAAYLAAHDRAVRWAAVNRAVIAERAAGLLRASATAVVDLAHNMAERTPAGILHRKGAAPADRGLVPVPGSRDTLSYLVAPVVPLVPAALASLAHGAGRKHDRGAMHGRVGRKRSDLERLARNRFGGHVVCEDRAMLIEEAPEAYKSIDQVIDDLVAHQLAQVVATFAPVVTFKSVVEASTRTPKGHRGVGFVDKRLRGPGGGRSVGRRNGEGSR